MNMKKKIAPLLAAALTMTSVLPAMASEVTNQDISNVQQAGSTTVVASVNGTDPGEVTYVVSVPSYIDFGSLNRDEGATGGHNYVDKVGTVALTQVEGLEDGQRVAVLMQDAANGTNGFQIAGVSGAALSNGQTLNYSVMINDQELNATQTSYPNGFLVGAFQKEGDNVSVHFMLDQNQMTGVLDDWAGTYQGTVTFYSRVAELSDYN